MDGEFPEAAKKVVNTRGEKKGDFDETHIVGSEVMRGVDSETAIFRAKSIDGLAESMGLGTVSTDWIRYALDELRDVDPKTQIPTDKLRNIREFANLRQQVVRKPAPGTINLRKDGPPAVPKEDTGEVLIASRPQTYHSHARAHCEWTLMSRKSTKQIVIRVLSEEVDVDSELFSTKDEIQEQLKNVLTTTEKEELKHVLNIEDIGLTSTALASMSNEQIKEYIQNYVITHTFMVIKYIVTTSMEVELWERWNVEEVWDWYGEDCPQPDPETVRYTLEGGHMRQNTRTSLVFWDKYAVSPQMSPEDAEEKAKRRIRELLSRGAWIPELPAPSGLPSPLDFSLSGQ